MAIELIRPRQEHIPELARICFEAFGSLHARHAMPRDFPEPEIARTALEMIVGRDDFFGVAAAMDGKLVGSNFLMTTDAVAGVGPITVDPACQARGIGRRLMQAVLDEADRRGIRQVRLQQEAFNMASLSLYTTLGFDWRDSCALMHAEPAPEDDPTIRPAQRADLPDIDRLSIEKFHNSRRNEVAAALDAGMPVLVRHSVGRLIGYLIPGFFGHGFAAGRGDLLALLGQAARRFPDADRRFLCPLSQPALFREALAAGCRTMKVFSYMARGPYTPPREAWLPSIAC